MPFVVYSRRFLVSYHSDKILFNVTPWQGITLVQGNKTFFYALKDLIGSKEEEESDIAGDITDCLSVTGYEYYSECETHSLFMFRELIQLNLVKAASFNLGETIQKLLPKCDASKIPVSVLFAFSKILQASAVGVKPTPSNRRYDRY